MADSDSLIGRTVSHHRIIEKSGRGMGLVSKAENTRLDRHLKFMPEDLAQDRQALMPFRVTVHSVKGLS
jgi:hypothetical protein